MFLADSGYFQLPDVDGLDEDEELDCAREPAFDCLFLGRRLGEAQEEEGEEEEVIGKEAPRRGSVMKGREGPGCCLGRDWWKEGICKELPHSGG